MSGPYTLKTCFSLHSTWLCDSNCKYRSNSTSYYFRPQASVILIMADCICETKTVVVNLTDDLKNLSGYTLDDDLYCPSYNQCCLDLVDLVSFWVEKVIQNTFAVGGILTNIFSCIILLASKGKTFIFMRSPHNSQHLFSIKNILHHF